MQIRHSEYFINKYRPNPLRNDCIFKIYEICESKLTSFQNEKNRMQINVSG